MNYLEHNKELHGSLYKPESPVIFTKADTALLKDHKPFFIPDHLGRIDYETELVVRISRLGKTIPQRFAHRYYDAVTVGIDFTARELQSKLRAEGKPWDLCKGFDGSAALGEWVSIDKFRDIQAIHFHLDINGKTVQEGCTSDMLYKVDELIAYISQYFTLKTGDILLQNKPWPSFLDGVGNGLGYAYILVVVGGLRELLGRGTLLGFQIIPQCVYDAGYINNGMMTMPAMALILLGCVIWVHRAYFYKENN